MGIENSPTKHPEEIRQRERLVGEIRPRTHPRLSLCQVRISDSEPLRDLRNMWAYNVVRTLLVDRVPYGQR